MIAPDVMLEDKDSIIISSEEGECDVITQSKFS